MCAAHPFGTFFDLEALSKTENDKAYQSDYEQDIPIKESNDMTWLNPHQGGTRAQDCPKKSNMAVLGTKANLAAEDRLGSTLSKKDLRDSEQY